jgi:predicted ATPase
MLLQAREAAGTVAYWRGEYSASWPHFEAGIALYDRETHAPLATLYGQDAGVVCRANGGQALWFLGEVDRSEALMQESLVLAREVGHLYSLALADCFAASSCVLRREPERVLAYADEALALSQEQDFPFWLGYARIMRGWAMAALGDYEGGVAELTAGMSSYEGTGAQLGGRYCVSLLAEIHAGVGRVDDALGLLAFALPALEQNEDGSWLAEIERVKGVLQALRAEPDAATAEGHFRSASRSADGQGARMLALRAATELARLWRKDRAGDARAILGPRLEAIRDGLATADVVDAREAMEALA